jgi:HEPN domain-containing protein
MSVPRRIAAFLDLASQDVDAARTLAATNNRYAAYHCQQAVEKLIKAVFLHRGLESGTEHRLDVLVDELPDGDPWKAKLRPLEIYSPYARWPDCWSTPVCVVVV